MNTIKKIVLTGGPCAGKTTALVKVIEHFSSLGYKVFTIPEVPTMFTQAGYELFDIQQRFLLRWRESYTPDPTASRGLFLQNGSDARTACSHRLR